LVSPVTVQVRELVETQVFAPGDEVTVYPVAAPPPADGTVQLTIALAVRGMAVTVAGASGFNKVARGCTPAVRARTTGAMSGTTGSLVVPVSELPASVYDQTVNV